MTRRYTALGVGLGLDGPELRVREKSKVCMTPKVERGYAPRRKEESLTKASVVELTRTSLVKEARRRNDD